MVAILNWKILQGNELKDKMEQTPAEMTSLGKKIKQNKILDRFKSVLDFLSDVINACEKKDFSEAVSEALPWAEPIGESISEAVPPIKLLVQIFRKITDEKDPDVLGHLACTLAYENAVGETIGNIKPLTHRLTKVQLESVKKNISEIETPEKFNFKRFSFGSALTHPFTKTSDLCLQKVLCGIGCSEDNIRSILSDVHSRFVVNLKTLISHKDLKEKFLPFRDYMHLGSSEEQVYGALVDHGEYQRWLFEEAPVLNKEPFALSHIHIPAECGKLFWRQIKDYVPYDIEDGLKERHHTIDPFLEHHGERHSLVESVLRLMADPEFRDAIVIQGVAGSGKSVFTLNLCSTLIKKGLRPIRIMLRDLRHDIPWMSAIEKAVRLTDPTYKPRGSQYPRPDKLFLEGNIFKEEIIFDKATICPYVLILDGWDEISISASESFKIRLDRMLESLRAEFLQNSDILIRVILTGRPSTALTESVFLQPDTPILTIRPIKPCRLENYVKKLDKYLKERPVNVEDFDEWEIGNVNKFSPVFTQYKKDFEASLGTTQARETKPENSPLPEGGKFESLDILGLPLLAYLAVKLMVKWDGPIEKLLTNRTLLLKSLVDLTCRQAGKAPYDRYSSQGQPKFVGVQLRCFLQKTAEAMTICGQESISHAELNLRLNLSNNALVQTASLATKENILTSLMISFFFKDGNRELGCEFMHKSFREYLFAERVIEVIKKYGRSKVENSKRREFYWKDFSNEDLRFHFSRKIAKLLSSHWLSKEVEGHLKNLIFWEINRKETLGNEKSFLEQDAISLTEWENVRDSLADMWEWWGDGVHLRPNLTGTNGDKRTLGNPLVVELAIETIPKTKAPSHLPPLCVTVTDAYLGNALFIITAFVHYDTAVKNGWLDKKTASRSHLKPEQLWERLEVDHKNIRLTQSLVKGPPGKKIVLFSPSKNRPENFKFFAARINGAGWRPAGYFPSGCKLSGIDLHGVAILIPIQEQQNKEKTIWTHANMNNAVGSGSLFFQHDAREVLADQFYGKHGHFRFSILEGASLKKAVLNRADFTGANMRRIHLEGADLREACLENCDLTGAYLEGADLREANFRGANLEGASLTGAKTEHAIFQNAKGAIFDCQISE